MCSGLTEGTPSTGSGPVSFSQSRVRGAVSPRGWGWVCRDYRRGQVQAMGTCDGQYRTLNYQPTRIDRKQSPKASRRLCVGLCTSMSETHFSRRRSAVKVRIVLTVQCSILVPLLSVPSLLAERIGDPHAFPEYTTARPCLVAAAPLTRDVAGRATFGLIQSGHIGSGGNVSCDFKTGTAGAIQLDTQDGFCHMLDCRNKPHPCFWVHGCC